MIATTRDYFKLHFIVFLWGFTAVLGKLISIPPVEMVFYRTLLAAIGMAVLMIFLKKSFAVSRKDLVVIFLTSIIVAIHWVTFFVSGNISNPSTSLVGFATCSFWAAFIEPIAKRKNIQLLEIGLGLIVLLGLTIILTFNFQYPMGLFLGIVSGMTAALFSVINSKLVHQVNAYTITFYEMLGACLVILFFMPVYQNTWAPQGELNLAPTFVDWIYIAIMALACSVYAFSVSINLSKKLSVFFIQLALNLEPVYGIILALLVFGQKEVMSLNFYVGTIIILCAVIAYPVIKKKQNQSIPIQ
ncbi:MAG TPA: DMT family transporter [Cyclobacteriaceae bacterium]|nr:DMT family transporter [Cyclobacteriaceae bacterium]